MTTAIDQLSTWLTLFQQFLSSATRTFWHRRRLGPRFANWSWLMESVADLTISAVPDRPQIAVQEIRDLFDQTATLPVPTLATITPVSLGGVPGERQQPRHVADGRVILFFHGGGYVAGSPQSHRLLTTRIAKEAQALLYSMDYRLAPEHPYPAGLEDGWRAYMALLRQGIRPEEIVLGGDSAGAGLSIALLLALREARLPLPAAAFCLSPFFDLSCETAARQVRQNSANREKISASVSDAPAGAEEEIALADYINLNVLRVSGRAYIGDFIPTYPYISPLYANLAGLPPLLIQAGSTEVLAGDAINFANRARAAGVRVQLSVAEHMIHVYHFLYHIAPEADDAVRQIGGFVREQTTAIDHKS